jgi:hypothetical protein
MVLPFALSRLRRETHRLGPMQARQGVVGWAYAAYREYPFAALR